MSHAAGKFIAVILAIWLPLKSGNQMAKITEIGRAHV